MPPCTIALTQLGCLPYCYDFLYCKPVFERRFYPSWSQICILWGEWPWYNELNNSNLWDTSLSPLDILWQAKKRGGGNEKKTLLLFLCPLVNPQYVERYDYSLSSRFCCSKTQWWNWHETTKPLVQDQGSQRYRSMQKKPEMDKDLIFFFFLIST